MTKRTTVQYQLLRCLVGLVVLTALLPRAGKAQTMDGATARVAYAQLAGATAPRLLYVEAFDAGNPIEAQAVVAMAPQLALQEVPPEAVLVPADSVTQLRVSQQIGAPLALLTGRVQVDRTTQARVTFVVLASGSVVAMWVAAARTDPTPELLTVIAHHLAQVPWPAAPVDALPRLTEVPPGYIPADPDHPTTPL